MAQVFPDIADILERKREGREALAARSFVEKIKSMEALRDRLAPFKTARLLRVHETAVLQPIGNQPMPWSLIDRTGDTCFMPEGREQPDKPKD